MEAWFKISLLLSIFGFLKEIRPSEPFVYEYLIGPWRNLTDSDVNQEVYPVGTYSYLAQLVLVFLVTDWCRYKPLIVVLGISGIIIWAMLLWTTSLWALQVLEVFYGTFMATEIAYYTYIYAKVDSTYFQKVTSHTRAAILAGRLASGILAQVLISYELMDYRDLNYITLTAMVAATTWCLLLPSGKKSIYFHPEDLQKQNMTEQDMTQKESLVQNTKSAFLLMKIHFFKSFSNKYVVKWSIWWALSTCGFIQVQTYMQPLWTIIRSDPSEPIYNGATEAVLTFIGFLGALTAGYLKTNWERIGELILGFCSLVAGLIMVLSSQTDNVFISYACYCIFGGLYHFMITIASAEIAKHIEEDSYGLVFSFNTLIALSLQSVLTVVVVTKSVGFALGPRDQYFVYGIYHVIIAVFYSVIGIVNCRKSSTAELPVVDPL